MALGKVMGLKNSLHLALSEGWSYSGATKYGPGPQMRTGHLQLAYHHETPGTEQEWGEGGQYL